jgi:peptidoglycan hydrolase CwlO-like protein
MTIIEMAKAHLQNVHNKLNELQENKKILEQEIEKLSNYIKSGLELIQKEEEVSN